MFKISPLRDVNLLKEYLEKCNVKVIPGAFVYAMTDIDSGELMAVSQFEITEVCGYIYNLCSVPELDDFEAMFILGRQTMNFIDLCGMHTCRADENSAEEKLLKAIGFKKDSDGYICDMTGMFDGHCSGHKVELK